jgi:hypothetical protein
MTSKASGSQTATLNTEHTLATITDAGIYVLNVDVAALVNGETLQLRIKVKTRSGDSSRLAYHAVYKHVVGEPSVFSVPVPVIAEGVFTLEQNGGTGRAFPWNILQLDG